ncbi:hypothetical protein CK203_113248 [Vitis vinifera]|uniref:Uncharacterized protein n=1 Tax=Vitis vinifera TaxID=29760 RepID=A0A438CC05_VITVI|nr:hypothetical protein CK203_113248 [Vitis vinifera]
MGYSTKPHLERRHHCREHFTLDKWTQLAGYLAPVAAPPKPAPPMPPQAEQPQQDELPTESVPSGPAPPMPEATSTALPTTLSIPPAAPSTLEASFTISATEFCAMTDIPGPSKIIALVEETTPAKKTTPTEETTRADVRPRPLTRQPQSHHLHQRAPLLDHFFILFCIYLVY